MSINIDELGPVDWIVVEFPEQRFTGEVAPILKDLVDRELVRVLDLIFLTRVWSPTMLLSLYFFGCMLVFSAGLAAFFSTMQVYFRDTSSFLPYFVRIWMYLSPVLWLPENVANFSKPVLTVIQLNPMYAMLGGYAQLLGLLLLLGWYVLYGGDRR